MGSPLRGRGQIVLDRNEGLVSPFGLGTLVSSWLDIPPLSFFLFFLRMGTQNGHNVPFLESASLEKRKRSVV